MSYHRSIWMLVGLGVLSACSDADDSKTGARNDNGEDVSLSVGGGNAGSAKIEGKFKLPAIKLGDDDVNIDGVKLYPGAHVIDIDVAGEEGQSEGGVTINFEAQATPAIVRDYYLAAFKEKGLSATAQGNQIAGRDHAGESFSVILTAKGEGTRGVIKMGGKAG